jgi:ATP-dependent helicase HrpA
VPKDIRRRLIPLNDTIEEIVNRMAVADPSSGRLVDVLARTLSTVSGVDVSPAVFDLDVVPDHLRLHVVVSDDEGTVHGVGTDLDEIRSRLAASVRDSIAAAAPIEERRGIVRWDLGDLPRVVESSDRALDVRAYPALLDVGDSVSLRVVTTPELQQRVMRGGVRRLVLLDGAPTRSSVVRRLDNADRLAIAAGDIDLGELSGDCVAAAVDRVMTDHGELPWTEAEFAELQHLVRDRAPSLALAALRGAAQVMAAATEVSVLLARLHAQALRPSVDDANRHLGRLVHTGFVLASGIDRLADIERYVRAIRYRLEHLPGAHERDQRRMEEVVPLEERYARIVDSTGPGRLSPELVEVRWELEELRVATFAQPLAVKRPGRPPLSAVRIARTLSRFA